MCVCVLENRRRASMDTCSHKSHQAGAFQHLCNAVHMSTIVSQLCDAYVSDVCLLDTACCMVYGR